MDVICLRFPNKAIAHSILYGTDGGQLYPNIADRDRTGLPVERFVTEEGEVLRWPSDGSYCADIAGLDEVPDELQPYVITPNPKYRKHKFLGE